MAQYASATDLANAGLPAAALVNVTVDQQNGFLVTASGRIDSYLRAQYTLPLVVPCPDEIRRACLDMACYDLLIWRGYNPESIDANWRMRFEDTTRWLEKLASGSVALAANADSSAERDGKPRVYSAGSSRTNVPPDGAIRGW